MIREMFCMNPMILSSFLSFIRLMEARGVPAFEATLIFSGENRIGRRNRKVFEAVARDLESGTPLHETLENHNLVKRPECRHLLRMSGALGSDRIFEVSDPFLAFAWEKGRKTILGGWTYVLSILFISLGVLSFWGSFISPMARSLVSMAQKTSPAASVSPGSMTTVGSFAVTLPSESNFITIVILGLLAGRYLYPWLVMRFGAGYRFFDAYGGYMLMLFLESKVPVEQRCAWFRSAPGPDKFRADMKSLASSLESGLTPAAAVSRCSELSGEFKTAICEAEGLGHLESEILEIVASSAKEFVVSMRETVSRHEPWVHLAMSVMVGSFVVSAYGFINSMTTFTLSALS